MAGRIECKCAYELTCMYVYCVLANCQFVNAKANKCNRKQNSKINRKTAGEILHTSIVVLGKRSMATSVAMIDFVDFN